MSHSFDGNAASFIERIRQQGLCINRRQASITAKHGFKHLGQLCGQDWQAYHLLLEGEWPQELVLPHSGADALCCTGTHPCGYQCHPVRSMRAAEYMHTTAVLTCCGQMVL